jgi:hypothetical protein
MHHFAFIFADFSSGLAVGADLLSATFTGAVHQRSNLN